MRIIGSLNTSNRKTGSTYIYPILLLVEWPQCILLLILYNILTDVIFLRAKFQAREAIQISYDIDVYNRGQYLAIYHDQVQLLVIWFYGYQSVEQFPTRVYVVVQSAPF
jgi:hypothetical protein